MKLNKSSSYALVHLLNGCSTALQISERQPPVDIRTIQRALQRLVDLDLITRHGSNSPTYSLNFDKIIQAEIPSKLFDDENRPSALFNFAFVDWLTRRSEDQLSSFFQANDSINERKGATISAKELEYLTIELAWKSSALEGNTYTLLDTQLLLNEGVKAKNRTEFETQMILNHKNAISFIVENTDLFNGNIQFKTIEELHRIIGYNLGIDSGVRKKIVRISASNYEPLSGPQQLTEQADSILAIISKSTDPYLKSLLALSLIPYLQIFEDGNKRTGRLLANAILISCVGVGFSLRNTDTRTLAIAYLSFYEFNSIKSLQLILRKEFDL